MYDWARNFIQSWAAATDNFRHSIREIFRIEIKSIHHSILKNADKIGKGMYFEHNNFSDIWTQKLSVTDSKVFVESGASVVVMGNCVNQKTQLRHNNSPWVLSQTISCRIEGPTMFELRIYDTETQFKTTKMHVIPGMSQLNLSRIVWICFHCSNKTSSTKYWFDLSKTLHCNHSRAPWRSLRI